ncbi:uncharacterized mitochondrial protein AtMg00810-like [Pyrus communis]|uniref:uncharacterized mitochondrial protein AtMg00810-like n=1 Tax=Pyrus communis TaxID=23211 RepID=UPI0035BFD1EE
MEDLKADMMNKYEMIDLGMLYHFLGIRVMQTESSTFIHQKKYATSLLKKFLLQDCKPVSIPLVPSDKLRKYDESEAANEAWFRKIVESLMYLTVARPDIMYTFCLLARFMHYPTNKHYKTAKRVLRYIQNTLDYGLECKKVKEQCCLDVVTSDWSGSENDMRSTSGYTFTIESGVFSWSSVKQYCVALSAA